MDTWTIKDVLWTPFNTVFSPTCPSLAFVPKGLKESIGCPLDSFNTVFNYALKEHVSDMMRIPARYKRVDGLPGRK